MSKSSFVFFALLPLLVSATTNDWSTPCWDGWCSYDVSGSEEHMEASIAISGSPNSISDITKAAGWEVLNCSPDTDAQDIRIVCAADETTCSHLFENGAEHTIVRLPEDCGSVPFAQVTRCVEAVDQELPSKLKSRLRRRDGSYPLVHALSFNTKFDEVPASQHGNVSMVVYGSTIPGLIGDASIIPAGSMRRSRYMNKRGLFDSLLGKFNKTTNTDLPPVNIDQSFNVFNTTLSCSANQQARLSVDIYTKLNAQIGVGAVLAGQIIPPKIKDFGLFADVSADLAGGLTIDANIAGQIDTGKVPLFTVGLPVLSIPGILSLGPSFEIDAQALATIDLDVSLNVDLAYSFSELQLFFPPSDAHPSNAVVAPKNTPLKLSASPNVESNATLQAHLIPTLKFGLDVLGSGADIFLDLDTFAGLDLGLKAGATASVDSTGATNASAKVGGCVDINGGVSVNAGAEGSFFGLFDASTKVSLFSKDFDFFKKCFEESTGSNSGATITGGAAATGISNSTASATSESGRGISESATVPASDSIISSASFDPSVSVTSFKPSASITSSNSITKSNSFIPLSSSAASDVSSVPTVTSVSTGTMTVASTSVIKTSDDDSTSAPSSTKVTSAPSATQSSSSTKGKDKGKNPRGRGRSMDSSRKVMTKRDFQCLAPGIAAAASVVDQTVAGSSISS